MITQILTHTPIWVFFLFALLMVFGFMQTRTRTVARIPAMLLPVGMIVLSVAGMNSSLGLTPLHVALWGAALLATAGIGFFLFRDKRVTYDEHAQNFSIPGSWLPLAVIIAIFLTKYVFAVMQAFGVPMTTEPAFIDALCVVYGMLSGYFAARAITVFARAQAA